MAHTKWNPHLGARFARWTVRRLGPADIGGGAAPLRELTPEDQARHDAEAAQWERVVDENGHSFLVPIEEAHRYHHPDSPE